MKLQNLQEAISAGGEHVPHLVELQKRVKQHLKPDVTQDQIIRFICWMEAKAMHSQFTMKDFTFVLYEGMEALKDNPKGANNSLETFFDEDDLENSFNEVMLDARKYFT